MILQFIVDKHNIPRAAGNAEGAQVAPEEEGGGGKGVEEEKGGRGRKRKKRRS